MVRFTTAVLVLAMVGCDKDLSPPATAPDAAQEEVALATDAAPVDVEGDIPADSGPAVEVVVPSEAEINGLAQIVPSDRMPSDVALQPANNNLDIARHDGRIYLAFRTAETHFASPDVVVYVVSTVDEVTFDYEAEFHLGTDLREPRLLSFGGALFLYFSVLGTNMMDFEPKEVRVSRYQGPGQWTDSEPIRFGGGVDLPVGFLAWRTKAIDGVPYLLGYSGGENIYDLEGHGIDVYWMTTDDGITWEPVVPGQPVVSTGGGSETDFVFDDQGRVIAVIRNEKGDELGWGMKICRAEADTPGDWDCVGDPRKYDSPLMFRHGAGIFVIGRRNVTDTGNYDLGHESGTPEQKTLSYLATYSGEPKRCAVWQVDPDTLGVEHVIDLPSRGDTCFPAMVVQDAHHYIVYNYTSPLDGADLPWIDGQLGPTYIVRVLLGLP